MPKKENETYAYFKIANFEIDPQKITEKIGIEPSKYWKKGDLNPKNNLERKFNCWSLYSRLSLNAEMEDHIQDVLFQLDAQKDKVEAITQEYRATLELVGYFYEDYPGFFLDQEVIKKMANYRLGLDCDFYYLYEKENT